MATISKKTLKSMTLLQLIEKVVNLSSEKEISVTKDVKCYVNELAERTGLTPMEALFLSVFVNNAEMSCVRITDIAQHFGCGNVSVLAHFDAINALIEKRIVMRIATFRGETSYALHPLLMNSLMHDKLFDCQSIANLSLDQFVDVIDNWFYEVSEQEMDTKVFAVLIYDIIEQNKQLEIVQKMKEINLNLPAAINFLSLVSGYARQQRECCDRSVLRSALDRREFISEIKLITSEQHILMRENMIEHYCADGQVDSDNWCLSRYSKEVLLKDMKLEAIKKKSASRNNLIHHEDIEPKELFFSEGVYKQVKSLESLLEQNKMKRILDRLSDKGMRKGFTCVFYGAPGTGKTEECRQLSRLTGRDIMQVDIPSIRSKWVGETEQNIKAIFDNYKALVKMSQKEGSDILAPILLFNEADAIFNKRNEGSVRAVDKMENAMQNIILQEMETFEGILIATTNLTASMDSAFERRFLYKVEFAKPTPNERQHIWKSMIADLTDEQSLQLARQFDFSGGQIENIARKRIISDILEERDSIDFGSIIDSCQQELFNSPNKTKRIGF